VPTWLTSGRRWSCLPGWTNTRPRTRPCTSRRSRRRGSFPTPRSSGPNAEHLQRECATQERSSAGEPEATRPSRGGPSRSTASS
jgi:hypothetical protein